MSFYWFCLFVAANALLVWVLAAYVSWLRHRRQVAYGDGKDALLQRAIRAHANCVEYVPLYGLLIVALSLQQTAELWLGVLVLGFTLARVMHALGMIGNRHPLRFWGAAFTYLWMLVAIVLLCWELLV